MFVVWNELNGYIRRIPGERQVFHEFFVSPGHCCSVKDKRANPRNLHSTTLKNGQWTVDKKSSCVIFFGLEEYVRNAVVYVYLCTVRHVSPILGVSYTLVCVMLCCHCYRVVY